VLGAQLGLFFGALCQLAIPAAGLDPIAFAVVGMAAFFTAAVQAPVTGIVLVIEMTASFSMLLPMIAACFAAMLVPNLLRGIPIYDALRERVRRLQLSEAGEAATRAANARAENSR
jgi:chloride channel protein, CIC family